MAVQGAMNAQASKRLGLPITLALMFTTALCLSVTWSALRGPGDVLRRLGALPLPLWAAGPLGAFIGFAVIRSVRMMGVGATTGVVVAAQVLASVALDETGLFGLKPVAWTAWRWAGSVLLIAGGYLLSRR